MTNPRDDLMALAPCPFCGGEAERIDIPTVGSDPELGGDPNAGGSCISCKRCAASTALHFDRKENLYSSWNDRAASRPVPVDREAVTRAFVAGAMAVHEEWLKDVDGDNDGPPRGDPEFDEAAKDYAASLCPAEPVEAERPCKELYRHKKRGTTYRILHGDEYRTCIASSATVAQIDHEPMVVYQDVADGKVWVRPRVEFFDGRFEKLPRADKPPTTDAVGEPVAWRARRLEWVERIGVDGTFDASTSIGHYIATITDDGRGMWFVVGLTTSNYIDGDISAVQFAAQSDYENRIRSAIEVAPHPPASPDTSAAVIQSHALKQALDSLAEIASSSIPDCPSYYSGDELAWAQRHVSALRHKAEIARDGIAAAIREAELRPGQLPTPERGGVS